MGAPQPTRDLLRDNCRQGPPEDAYAALQDQNRVAHGRREGQLAEPHYHDMPEAYPHPSNPDGMPDGQPDAPAAPAAVHHQQPQLLRLRKHFHRNDPPPEVSEARRIGAFAATQHPDPVEPIRPAASKRPPWGLDAELARPAPHPGRRRKEPVLWRDVTDDAAANLGTARQAAIRPPRRERPPWGIVADIPDQRPVFYPPAGPPPYEPTPSHPGAGPTAASHAPWGLDSDRDPAPSRGRPARTAADAHPPWGLDVDAVAAPRGAGALQNSEMRRPRANMLGAGCVAPDMPQVGRGHGRRGFPGRNRDQIQFG